jgi:hypothetical protein
MYATAFRTYPRSAWNLRRRVKEPARCSSRGATLTAAPLIFSSGVNCPLQRAATYSPCRGGVTAGARRRVIHAVIRRHLDPRWFPILFQRGAGGCLR